MKPLRQIAALPYVETGSGLEILLITTRGWGRWTIPKGWPKTGVPDPELAAREAFEEAGISGEVGAEPIATFLYTKRLHLFSWAECSVDVYPLHARWQELSWPEQASRRSVWIEPDKAAAKVRESGLAKVLRGLDSRSLA